jgi:1,4-dihydroxy-2-naphthoyl-CoA hydrolase
MVEKVPVSPELLEKVNMDEEAFLSYLNKLSENTLLETLDINYVSISPDCLVMSMPVTPKNHQPMGLLHGGASVVLAETAASMATLLNLDISTQACVGMEINANHIRSKKEGLLIATATPLHRGRTTMVWDIKLTDEKEKLICVSRCTMAVIKRPQ